MRKFLHIFIMLLLFATINLWGQDSGRGLGIMLGEPTGINGKLWLNEINAVDAGMGWAFAGPGESFSLHADYLYHIDNRTHENFRFPVYYGFGARIRNEAGDFGLGFRGVAGLLYYLDNYPADIFFEFVPVFKLLPETALELDLSVGARYYFN